MGEVYRARDTRLGREVAIKVLPEAVATDPDRLKRFEREARATAALSHPNVLTVFDVGAEDGRAFVVTELLEGTTVGARLRRGALPVREALALVAQAARGLAAAHAKGIVHRDLKPDNLFLTTTGALKILDFGLARLQAGDDVHTQETTEPNATSPGTVLGTVSYMSPEQAKGLLVDSRSDLFSLGVVLHEMLSGRHPFKRTTSAETVSAILRDEPPSLGALEGKVPSAVQRLARRCLEKRPEDRFQTAGDLAIALELLERGDEAVATPGAGGSSDATTDEERPYPGLSSFTEADAAHFFGREDDVRALWEKIRRQELLAVIGPSGVGKTSFLRAGVLARKPTGWAAVYCTPGPSPVAALARALSAAGGDEPRGHGVAATAGELMQGVADFLQHGQTDRLVSVAAAWRSRRAEALLVVDAFEELFTLNPRDAQERFAALLLRLVREAQLRVVLALRDDFLFRCHGLPGFDALFRDLTPLGTPSAGALRRAVVEPAARLGFRLEDPALADEMVKAVAGEGGALPLLAFAVSRLWDERDRERRLLTRSAHERIGGVAGALAGHAEATLHRIGAAREAIVHALFRELVSAEGTRASRTREEVLSVFGSEGDPKRVEAAAVLDALVAARLLTEFDLPGSPLGHGPAEPLGTTGVKIVHESLLSHWPRLERWLAQDAEGALLRDQLRQAARLWDEKGRPEELLWTGRAFREFALWRERYPGGLSATEDAFAGSMTRLAGRRRARRRLAAAGLLAATATVAVVTSVLWTRAEKAHRSADEQALRAEAGRLLALGQIEIDRHPTGALAYAMRSLELADTKEARHLALRALQRGPTVLDAPRGVPKEKESTSGFQVHNPAFDSTGEWLAIGGYYEAQVRHQDGRPPRLFEGFPNLGFDKVVHAVLRPGRDLLVAEQAGDIRGFTASTGAEVWRSRVEKGYSWLGSRGGRLFTVTRAGGRLRVRRWTEEGAHVLVADAPLPEVVARYGHDLDERGEHLFYASGRALFERSLTGGRERRLGTLPEDVLDLAVTPDGRRLATIEKGGALRLWSLESGAGRLARLEAAPGAFGVRFDPTGRWLAAYGSDQGRARVRLVDLLGPPAAQPLDLRRSDAMFLNGVAFHPSGRWLVSGNVASAGFWPLDERHPHVFAGHPNLVSSAVFTPDGATLLTASAPLVRAIPLSPEAADGARVLLERDMAFPLLRVDPGSRFVVVSGAAGRLAVLPLAGGKPRELRGFSEDAVVFALAVSPSGRRVAAGALYGRPDQKAVRVFDLESGDVVAVPIPEAADGSAGGVQRLAFDGEERLVAAGGDGLYVVDLRRRSARKAHGWAFLDVALVAPSGPAFAIRYTEEGPSHLVRLAQGSLDPVRVSSHGPDLQCVAVDPAGRLVATGSFDGVVRVGPVDGGPPHEFLGHEGLVRSVAFSPDGRWVASGGEDGTARLWPVPDASAVPPLTLSKEALLAKLGTFTNLRVVEDPGAPTGYRLQPGPFPGWTKPPQW